MKKELSPSKFVKYDSLFMIEPELIGYNGHLFNYAKSISDCLIGTSTSFKIFVSKNCERKILKEINSSVVFDKLPNGSIFNNFIGRFVIAVFQYNFHLYKGLRIISKKETLKNKLLFFGTIQHIHLFGLIAWIALSKKNNLPKSIILTLRLSIYRYDINRWAASYIWYVIAFRLIDLIKNKCKVSFITDSNKLQEEFAKITKIKIHLLPIPHTINNLENNGLDSKIAKDKLTFASLGNARKPKGFGILVDAIIELSDDVNFSKFHFLLQSNCAKNDDYILVKINEIKNRNFKNVELLEKELSEKDYYSLIQKSNVIIIPYDQSVYFANTSGILTEAISYAKPIIVTEGTWMSENMPEGVGVTFKDKNSSDLVKKMKLIAEKYSDFKSNLIQKSITWNEYHNATNFLKMLFQIGK
jgi:glycosyltransferase involved in cell wall biosynthesis